MAAVYFTCPNCAKVIRASARPAPGKKVECPECDERFVPELDDKDESDDQTEERSKPRSAAYDDEDDPPPSKKRSRSSRDDDDDDGDGDDYDRSIAKPSTKKKSSTRMIVAGLLAFLAAGGALVCCIGCGLGGFVWPGFFISDPPGNNQIADFVPADAPLLVGANTKRLREKNQLDAILRQLEQLGREGEGVWAPEISELLRNSESVLVCGHPNSRARGHMIVLTSDTAPVVKFKKNLSILSQQRLDGKHKVYKLNKRDWPMFVATPGDRLVILSDLGAAELTTILKHGSSMAKKDQEPQNASLSLLKTVEKSDVFVAYMLEDGSRGEIRKAANNMRGQFGLPAALPNAFDALARAKGVSFSADNSKDREWKLTANVVCGNPNDARDVKGGGDSARQLVQTAALLGGFNGNPDMPPVLIRDIGTLACVSQGDSATLTMQLSSESLDHLIRQANRRRF